MKRNKWPYPFARLSMCRIPVSRITPQLKPKHTVVHLFINSSQHVRQSLLFLHLCLLRGGDCSVWGAAEMPQVSARADRIPPAWNAGVILVAGGHFRVLTAVGGDTPDGLSVVADVNFGKGKEGRSPTRSATAQSPDLVTRKLRCWRLLMLVTPGTGCSGV